MSPQFTLGSLLCASYLLVTTYSFRKQGKGRQEMNTKATRIFDLRLITSIYVR